MLFIIATILIVGTGVYCWIAADRALAVGDVRGAVRSGLIYATVAAPALLMVS